MDSTSYSLRTWLYLSMIAFLAISCRNQSSIQKTWLCVDSDAQFDSNDLDRTYIWNSPRKELWHFSTDSLFTMGLTHCYDESFHYSIEDDFIFHGDSLIGELRFSTTDTLYILTDSSRIANAFVPFVTRNPQAISKEDLRRLLMSKKWKVEIENQTWVLNFKSGRYLSECGFQLSATIINERSSESFDDMWWGVTGFHDHILLNFGFNEEWNFQIVNWSEHKITTRYLLGDFTWQEVLFDSDE